MELLYVTLVFVIESLFLRLTQEVLLLWKNSYAGTIGHVENELLRSLGPFPGLYSDRPMLYWKRTVSNLENEFHRMFQQSKKIFRRTKTFLQDNFAINYFKKMHNYMRLPCCSIQRQSGTNRRFECSAWWIRQYCWYCRTRFRYPFPAEPSIPSFREVNSLKNNFQYGNLFFNYFFQQINLNLEFFVFKSELNCRWIASQRRTDITKWLYG